MQGMLQQRKQEKGRGARRLCSLLLSLAMVLGGIGVMPMERAHAEEENLIVNPNFADADMSAWMDTGATITREEAKEAIFDDVKTYATISGRTQSYQGFSQDVTAKVIPGEEYEVSFFVKLSEDYADLAAHHRQVFFGPYVVENGETKYLSQSYSADIRGNLVSEVPAGQWVKLSGIYTVSKKATQVVVRFQEESSSDKGAYSITGVSMVHVEKEQKPEKKANTEELPILRDAITAQLGKDTIVGMVTHPVNNEEEWAILTTHANAMTAGNEFKPDAHFGYSVDYVPGTETVTLNGKKLLVPKINYSRGEQVLDAVLEYNQANPDYPIKVRGHVLVWHAQTPEWFFHEDYVASKPYVTKEVMDQRLEWYIKSLFEHYMGKNSKYKGLFYGWDVVNEACSDSTKQVYRDDQGGNDKLTDSRHTNKSSWWHIYESNEYIINAFKYANKYAPADVELYYNDYNDIMDFKVPNICALLKAVKEQEGAPGVGTRIDAFGMQAHYGMDSFSITAFESAARQYLDIVGKIQLTELDMGASSNYDGTEATKDQEYQDQALVYQSIYEALKKLDAIEGYEVGGITFWGVTDPTSWLQNKSDLGGGADGLRSQCPLLFDGNYDAKPAFWAFVDPSKIKLIQKKVDARRSYDKKFTDGVGYTAESGATSVTITPIWNEECVSLQLEVTDKTLDGDADSVTVYWTEDLEGKDGATPQIVKLDRTQCGSMGGGYKTTVKIPLSDMRFGRQFLFDVKIINADGTTLAFNDLHFNQENSTANYALCTLKPALTRVAQGTPVIDGEPDEVWNTTKTLWFNVNIGEAACAAKAKVLWDAKNLYVYAVVEDGDVSVAGAQAFEKDSLEVFIDEDHVGGKAYAKDDKCYRISAENEVTTLGKRASERKVESKTKKTENGYVIEAAFAWTDVKPKVHTLIGFDLRVNDAKSDGTRIGTLSWCDATGEDETAPSCFGTLKLAAEGEALTEEGNPDQAISQAKAFTNAGTEANPGEGKTNEGKSGDEETDKPAGEEKNATADEEREEAENASEPNMGRVVVICFALAVLLGGALFGWKASEEKSGEKEEEKK